MNYEYLKELPTFEEYCDQRLDSKLPSISEIRQRHYLMQGLTSLDTPVNPGDRLAEARRRGLLDNDNAAFRTPNYRSHIYPQCSLEDVQDWRHKDSSIQRIIDENTGRPARYYHRGIDNLDFLNNNFYRSPEQIDLKLKTPRKGFAGSIVDRAMYW